MLVEEKRAMRDGVEVPIQCMLLNIHGDSVCGTPHYHDYIEILYVLEGKFNVHIGTKIYLCTVGDMAVINSKEVHATSGSGIESRYIVVKLLPQIIHTAGYALFDIKYALPFTLDFSPHPRVIKRNETENSEIPYIMKSMLQEWNTRSYGHEFAIKTKILQLFLWILRYWNSHDIEVAEHSQNSVLAAAIQKAVEYTLKNYATATAEEAAKHCGLSYSYFCTSFKKLMKKSFKEYLTYVKLSQAEKQLVCCNDSITEIAYNCGFSSSSYFISQFKKQKNMSPCQFRNKFKN